MTYTLYMYFSILIGFANDFMIFALSFIAEITIEYMIYY